MKFSKLSKEKRQHLVLVVVATIVILSALGFYLIKGGYDKLSVLDQKRKAAEEKLDQMQKTVMRTKETELTFQQTSEALTEKEAGMATGDLYSWIHSSLRKFQRGYKVEIPQISPASAPEDVNLFPKFPYKQTTVNIGGTAYYHDLGRFIADFENNFPLLRIANLSLDLNASPTFADRDKLAFRMDIVTLIKPGKS